MAMRPSFLLSVLAVAHITVAAVVVFALHQQHDERLVEVQEMRDIVAKEERITEQHQHELAVLQALLEGLRSDDPYVVELLARDRLGLRSSEQHEVAPPRLQHPPLVE